MSEGQVFKSNISYPTDAMLSMKGCYVTSKDEKVIVETKDINREKRIDVHLRGFSSFTEAKKIAEIISILLIEKNGFIRKEEDITIEKDKTGRTVITLK